MGKATQYHQTMVHFIRADFDLADLTSGTAKVIGTLPKGAVVKDAYCVIDVAFDSGTSDVADLGTSGDPDGFATDLDVSSVGKKVADELATSDDLGPYAAETDIHFTWTGAGTAASTGSVTVVVEFIPDNA